MTMRVVPKLCLWMAVVAGLVGCTSDDPNKGGFFGGLIGLGSGAYEQRLDDEEATLKADETRYRQEVKNKAALNASVEERRAEADDLKRHVASLRDDVDDLDVEIASLRQKETVTLDDVERAEADVASLLDDIDRIEEEQAAHEQAKALGADADSDTDPAAFGEPPREQISDLRAYINKLQTAVDALKASRAKRAGEALPGADEAAE